MRLRDRLADRIASYIARHIPHPSPPPLYLGGGLVLVTTNWGGRVVVPGYNVDVSVGLIRDGVHEPWTTRLVRELLQPGQTYVNVGANFGYYSVLGAMIVGSRGKVLAIEANPTVFAILMKTIYFAGFPDRIEAYNRAAYLESGLTLEFSFDYQFIGGGHLSAARGDSPGSPGPWWDGSTVSSLLNANGAWIKSAGLLQALDATTIAIDDIGAIDTVDVLHCDVEQAEPFVLLGAARTIARSKSCRIIFEWSGHAYAARDSQYRDTVRRMWQMLSDEGFYIRQLRPILHADGGIEVSPPLSFEQFIGGEHGDYIAIRRKDDPWG